MEKKSDPYLRSNLGLVLNLVTHTEDSAAHIKAVFEDAEYWRTKRLEPVLFQLIRKGKVTLYDLIRASNEQKIAPGLQDPINRPSIEESIEALELNLGRYINGIEIAAQVARDSYFIDEQRKDAGIYDPELKISSQRIHFRIKRDRSTLRRAKDARRGTMKSFKLT